jgi:hypothetical protein
MDCQICFSNESIDKLKCYCDFNICNGCFEKWILSNPGKDPTCPNCKRNLSQEFIYSNFSSSFLKNDYYKWRKTYLALREKMYFLDDFEAVHFEKKRRLLRKKLKSLYKNKKRLLSKKLSTDEINYEIQQLLKEMPKSIFRIKTTNKNIGCQYVLPCPKCRGYIQDMNYICNLCEVDVCRNCLDINNASHACREEDIQNAKKF